MTELTDHGVSRPRGPGPLLVVVAVTAFATVAAAGILFVLQRVGMPARTLSALAIGLVIAGWAIAAVVSGSTMRFKLWLTGGRELGGRSVTLLLAGLAAFSWPALPPFPTAIGLVAGALLVAPALRAAGAPSLASWLGAAHRSRTVRFMTAAVTASVALGLGTTAFATALVILSARIGWTATQSAVVLAVAVAVTVAPGGLRGVVHGALALLAVILAGLLAAAPGATWGIQDIGANLTEPLTTSEGAIAGLACALGVMVLPPFLATAVVARPGADVRNAWLRAAAAVAILGGSSLVPAATAQGAMARELLALAGALAGSAAAAYCAAVALGDAVGPIGRRSTPLSRRFAWHRLASLLCVAAMAMAALRLPAARLALPACALAAASLLPPVLLLRSGLRSTRLGALAGMSGGGAIALLVLDGRYVQTGITAGSAGLMGALAGVAIAAIVSRLGGPAADPAVRLDDDSL
jgi:hypothetical protein